MPLDIWNCYACVMTMMTMMMEPSFVFTVFCVICHKLLFSVFNSEIVRFKRGALG